MKYLYNILLVILLTSCITAPDGAVYVVNDVIIRDNNFTQYNLSKVFKEKTSYIEKYVFFEYQSQKFSKGDTLWFDENKKLIAHKKR